MPLAANQDEKLAGPSVWHAQTAALSQSPGSSGFGQEPKASTGSCGQSGAAVRGLALGPQVLSC